MTPWHGLRAQMVRYPCRKEEIKRKEGGMSARKREKTCLGRKCSKSYLAVCLNHRISWKVGGRGGEATNSAEKR